MFNTEATYQNQKSFVCTMADFGQIEEIAKSRNRIRDQIKHEKYNETMMAHVKKVLTEQREEEIIIGTKDVNTGKLLCYTIVFFPAGSGFYFVMTAEAAHSENILDYDNSGLALMHFLISEIALKRKIFNGFSCMKINSLIPALMLHSKSVVNKHRVESRIHSVIHPGKEKLTKIEKVFMESGFGLYDRSDTSFGIVHMSTFSNFRLEYL